MGTTVERFYLLHIKASSLKVMVPCQNAGSVGMRRVVRNGEIQKVLDALSVDENGSATATGKTASRKTPNACAPDRFSRSPASSRSLIALHQAKPLSFREKKMLERARYLLVSELAMARNCEESKVEEILTDCPRQSASSASPKPRNSRPNPFA